MALRHFTKATRWRAAALCSVVAVCAPDVALAGFFDFLFGAPQPQAPSPAVQSYAEPGPVAPPALGSESVRQGSVNSGRTVAYCVRLCDGQHFPLERINNATPVETCRAMCPASRTKVFFGSEIGAAVAKDGARYADLDMAFVYRDHLVANCTCNGRDAFGLAPFEMANDPTLRPGDIVSTKQGLMTYTGKANRVAQFTPVNAASIATQLNSVTSKVALNRRGDAADRGRSRHDRNPRRRRRSI